MLDFSYEILRVIQKFSCLKFSPQEKHLQCFSDPKKMLHMFLVAGRTAKIVVRSQHEVHFSFYIIEADAAVYNFKEADNIAVKRKYMRDFFESFDKASKEKPFEIKCYDEFIQLKLPRDKPSSYLSLVLESLTGKLLRYSCFPNE